jgi:D-inositol-3-phosphate glycosyltransferase
MKVLYNGVNLAEFKPADVNGAKERSALGCKFPVLLYVGRVCKQKGTDLLIEAARRLRERSLPFDLVVAGPVGQFGQREVGDWPDRITEVGGHYLGAVEDSRLPGIYSMASVLVMPTVDLEMFGMAAVEAQACGVPVVASDHGGLRETVPLTSGVRFKTGSVEALADALQYVIANEQVLADLAKHARTNASCYSWDRVCEELDEVMIDVLKSR